MLVSQFAKDNSFSDRDFQVVVKKYKDKDMSEKEWEKELEGKINFKKKPTPIKVEKEVTKKDK